MVFHDATLDRLVGARGRIVAHTPAELSRLRYKDQTVGILTFRDLLKLVAGRVPCWSRSKRRPHAETLLGRHRRGGPDYRGPIALMSFDRAVVGELAELAPQLPRGIVIGRPSARQ